VARVTTGIGNVHSSTGNYPAALEHYHRALTIAEELGERGGVASGTGNILSSLIDAGEHAEAEAQLQRLVAMNVDNPVTVIVREHSRAKLQQNTGNTDEAVAILLAALEFARAHSLAAEQAELHKELRDLAQKRNDFAAYIEHNNAFMRITEEVNGKEATLKMAMQEKQREIDAERKETEKHMAVLHSTLPKHIADRVARGETVNDHHENATVIFLDIVGFTSISDRIPSGHVVHLLEQIFTTLDAVCEKHNIVKIKTIGDSYMAVSFDNIRNAAACALDMISSLDTLVITMPPSLGDTAWTKDVGDIKVRIGMHCGPVTAGVIGTQRMQYDVWGDTVNVASRMESTSEPGRIHISEAFAHAVNQTTTDAPYSIVERGTVEIKGKGPMTTYWLEGKP
jgi:class 3 adenylate cyclase